MYICVTIFQRFSQLLLRVDGVCKDCEVQLGPPQSLQCNPSNGCIFQHQVCFSWRICRMREAGICLVSRGKGTPVKTQHRLMKK